MCSNCRDWNDFNYRWSALAETKHLSPENEIFSNTTQKASGNGVKCARSDEIASGLNCSLGISWKSSFSIHRIHRILQLHSRMILESKFFCRRRHWSIKGKVSKSHRIDRSVFGNQLMTVRKLTVVTLCPQSQCFLCNSIRECPSIRDWDWFELPHCSYLADVFWCCFNLFMATA